MSGPPLIVRGVRGVKFFFCATMDSIYNQKDLLERRRSLRHNQTEAEKVIWNIVRNKQLRNLKFFRQYSAGNYILDFFCPAIRLAIELDGGQHNETKHKEYDDARTEFLNSHNIVVLRFWNNDVLQNMEGVYEVICRTLDTIKLS